MPRGSRSSRNMMPYFASGIALLVVVSAVAVIGISGYTLSGQQANYLVPGPEGVDAGVYGFQPGVTSPVASAASLGPMQGYSWVSNDAKSAVVSHQATAQCPGLGYLTGPSCSYASGPGEVRAEVQRPAAAVTSSDPFQLPANNTLVYDRYTEVNSTQVELQQVVATLVPVDFVVTISSVPGQGYYTFDNGSYWIYLNTVSWYNAFSSGATPSDPVGAPNSSFILQGAQEKGAFPIIAWVQGYNGGESFTQPDGSVCSPPGCYPPSGISQFTQTSPSLQGRFVDLYTQPSSRYTDYFASCAGQAVCSGISNSAFVEQALSPNSLPDPRFAETVFTPFTLASFGPYVDCTGVLSSCASHDDYYPSVTFDIRVVYAFYGQFTYLWTTQTASQVGYHYSGPNATWQARTTDLVRTVDPITGAFQALAAWGAANLGLPSFIAGYFLLALALVFIVAVVYVMFVFISKRLGVSGRDRAKYGYSGSTRR